MRSRRPVLAACVVAAAALALLVSAQLAAAAAPSSQVQADALKGAQDLARKADVLLQLGAWDETQAQPLAQVVTQLGIQLPTDHDDLVSLLTSTDAATEADEVTLEQDGVELSPDASVALSQLTPSDLQAAEDGQAISLDWEHILAGLDDLANRNGEAPPGTGPRSAPDPTEVLSALQQQAPATTTVSKATPGSYTGTVLLIGLALALVVGGGLFTLRRYLHPDARRDSRGTAPAPGVGMKFDELLAVSRRLAGIASSREMHPALLREAIGLVGARTGALVLRDGDALVVGYEGEPGLLVRERLAEGAIGRVAETGQPLVEVSESEPSIRDVPVALVGVPLIVGGSVYAVLVLVRGEATPFGSVERDMLSALAPIAASALLNAEKASEAAEQNLVDPLTGVGNRERLDGDLAESLADPDRRPLALVLVDLDHFRSVNDRYGHPTGDDLLRTIAGVVRDVLGGAGGVYRHGGEEFAVVLPATSLEDAVVVAERVRAAVGSTEVPIGNGLALRPTASLGVAASLPGEPTTPADLLALADEALDRAKSSGRDCVCAADLALAP
jgi:diguanylate cyclase (GGDEF)-like protein